MCRELICWAACLLVLTLGGIAQAKLFDPPVKNPSFESPSLGTGGTGQWADHADDWKLNASGWAYLEDGSWEIVAPDGINVMKLWSGAYLWQQIGTWNPNTDYEVGLWLGRGASSSSLQVELWAGGNPSLLPTSNFGEIDATVGAVLIVGGTLTPSVAVGESEWMTLTLNTGTGFTPEDALWIRILCTSDPDFATWVDHVTVSRPPNPALASEINPVDGTTDTPWDGILSWTAGQFAAAHDVYLGTVFEDVDTASRGEPKGVLLSQGQTVTTYDPASRLNFDQTYYWRVDEVNSTPDAFIHKGQTWSFTTEPYGYRIATPIKATASSYSNAAVQPDKTIDGSGLHALDQHSTTTSAMWLSKKSQTPVWIQYEFDSVYSLHQMWVWNQNQMIELDNGYGAKDVTIETSTDGTTWTPLAGVPEFAQGTGEETYVHNTTVEFGGVSAKFVKLNINSNWGGAKSSGLSEVRFFYVPVKAFRPTPATGATGVSVDKVLNWRPGRRAASHEVYLGTDPNALAKVGTVTEHRYGLISAGAEYDRMYYWKVNEVNNAEIWGGDVWSFSTPGYVNVDDFESYDDKCKRIFYTWADGYGTAAPECGAAPVAGNGSNAAVGNSSAPYAERTIVHGGRQSMPLYYDNPGASSYSEATRTFTVPQDWVQGGIKTLVLYFHGAVDNAAGQLYVKINNTKVAYNGNAQALTLPLWKQWNIDLASVGGNLRSVGSLMIGVSGSGKGLVFIDDIRLYSSAPALVQPADPGTAGLSAYYAMDGDMKDGSGKGNHGTLVNDPVFVDSMAGFGKALQFDGVNDYVELPIGTLMSTLDSATFATWVNFDTSNTNTWQRMFDFGSGTTNYLFLCPRTSTSGVMRFAIRRTTSMGESLIDAPMTLPKGWHHVAVVIDSQSKTMQLCLDGDVVASGTTLVLPKDLGVTNQNWLGRSQYTADGYFTGGLDEFRIYNRALSEGEVRYLAGDR